MKSIIVKFEQNDEMETEFTLSCKNMCTKISTLQVDLMKLLRWKWSDTALHYAAMRGDMEIVELLLSAGADPSLKNDLGQDAAAMCKSFPELRGVLEKRERKMKLRGYSEEERVLSKFLERESAQQHRFSTRCG